MNWRFLGLLIVWTLLSPLIRHWLGISPEPGYASYATGVLSNLTFLLGAFVYSLTRQS